MKLDNPQKFMTTGDGTLIARGEIKCQFSSDDTNWDDLYDENSKWIRISFDNGTSWSIKYKLNMVEEELPIYKKFTIEDNKFSKTTNEDADEYTHKYVIPITDKKMFDQNYGKTLNIAIYSSESSDTGSNNESNTEILKNISYINYFAPVQWKQIVTAESSLEYSVEIFFNDHFISNYAGWTCIIKSS
jgi:hypothetical protein